MIEHNFDPWTMLEQLQVNQHQLDINQRNIVMAVNNLQAQTGDQDRRLDLNQASINQILASLQNQQKLIMMLLDKMVEISAVNSDNKGSDIND